MLATQGAGQVVLQAAPAAVRARQGYCSEVGDDRPARYEVEVGRQTPVMIGSGSPEVSDPSSRLPSSSGVPKLRRRLACWRGR